MDPSPWEYVGVGSCIIFSAFFSGSETALTSLSPSRSHQILDEGGRKARLLELWINFPNRILTTILIGNNLVNIAASALATDLANRVFQHGGVAAAIGIMTFLILIFGEVVPKTFARHNAHVIAIPIMRILYLFYYFFFPLTWLLVKFTRGVIEITGGAASRKGPFVTEDDISYLISLGKREGVIGTEKEKLLSSIFEFSDIMVKEVMVPRTDIVALDVETPNDQIVQFLTSSRHSRVPIFQDHLDNIDGILYVKDVFKNLRKDQITIGSLKDLMRTPYYVPETKKISELLKEFQKRKLHLAIVVDEFGGTSGLATLEDILEEIVGDILDEHDVDRALVKVVGIDRLMADARIPLRDLEDYIDVKFPEEKDYETLGGFVTDTVGKVPKPDTQIIWGNYQFKVKDADEKKVKRVEIFKRTDPTKKESTKEGENE